MLKLKVPDMSCGHCAGTIEKVVKSVDPTAHITVGLGSSTVAVETGADENAIRDVIRAAGYDNEKAIARIKAVPAVLALKKPRRGTGTVCFCNRSTIFSRAGSCSLRPRPASQQSRTGGYEVGDQHLVVAAADNAVGPA